jgi:glycosyltransferase involved in cell wall biosynthesis
VSKETARTSSAIRFDLRPETPPADHVFPELDSPASWTGAAKGRICLVCHELVGVANNGGVGTAQTNIAKVLAAGGHEVTILFLKHASRPLSDEVAAYYAGLGIRVVQDQGLENDFHGGGRIGQPFGVYEWLKSQDFDVVHGPELFGFLYFAMIAKQLGLAFANTLFVVGTHAPTEWLAELNHTSLWESELVVAALLERGSVALADMAWSPSRHLLDWMRAGDWPLGDNSYFQRLAYLPYDTLPRSEPLPETPVTELVFFGRLQKRKGIELFLDAIDRLQPAIAALGRPFKVTFLGDNQLAVFGLPEDMHKKRAERWGHDWQLIENFDTPTALAYLREPGRVAVIPSLSDNSPNTVHECLLYGIPFAASKIGGIPEMVAPEEQERVLFATQADACAQVLAKLIAAPARPVKPAYDIEEVNRSWVRWHDHAVAAARAAEPPAPVAAPPSITVVIAHRDRAPLLRQALRSLERQSWRAFDVVVVDAGSTDPGHRAELDAIGSWLEERGWRLIRQESGGLAQARNRGAAEAAGDHLFFLEDGDVLTPHALEMFAATVTRTGAEILNSVCMTHASDEEPTVETPIAARAVYLGGGLATAGFWDFNLFGGASFLIRRDSFATLGGFAAGPDTGHEHVELYVRAELAGIVLASLPEPLIWARKPPEGRVSPYLGNRLQIGPLYRQAPPYLRLMLVNAQDIWRELRKIRRNHDEARLQRDQYLLAAYSLSQERDQLKGKLATVEKALATAQQINEMLMEKLTTGLTGR